MKTIRNYSNIWKTEGVVYRIQDITLPRPVMMSQFVWFAAFFIASLFLKGLPPFLFTDSVLMNHVAIPAFLAWMISRKSFDGRKPYSFFRSYILYMARPKSSVRGKAVEMRNRNYRNMLLTVGKGRQETKEKRGDGR